jgi:ABC-type cobalamin/Fe3+-siderophores transport system ATPase subunit
MTLRAEDLGAHVPGPPARWLVRGLGLTVAPGEVWALVGKNGSGKSTLLRCLAGLRRAEQGAVHLGDRPLHALPGRERAKRLAYLPQLTPLYHDLRARQVVMLGRAPHLSRLAGPSAADERRVDEALARVEATALAERPLSTLSGGERQRVMLARLLATGAEILLLDEPTTALDIGHALRLLALCRDLARDGAAVVLAMHELELARRHADLAVCLGVGPGGEHRLGPAAQVLTPAILGPVFDVEVREVDGTLAFGPRR